MRHFLVCLLALMATFTTSCRGTRIIGNDVQIEHALTKVATLPVGGELASRIATTLNHSEAQEAHFLSTKDTADLLTRLKISSLRISRPENIEQLVAEGVDAYLRIEVGKHLLGSATDRIEVKLFSTHDPDVCLQFVWHNARGGMKGSLADASMRKDDAIAIEEICAELLRRLNPSTAPTE